MKRLLSCLIVVVLVVFVGFKVLVWWLADQRLAEARAGLSEQGVLQRGQISSALDGRLLLKHSDWQDFRLTQPLEMGLAEFDLGSPVSLLTTLMTPDSLPATWRLTVEQARLALEPVMFRNWVTAGASPEETRTPLIALSCAPDPRQQLGSGDLTRMGIDALYGELILEQTPGGLRAELNTEETGSLEVYWPGARLQLQDMEPALVAADAPARVTLRDAGLMRRLSAYCGRETGLTVNEWAARAVQALRAGFQARGYQPSQQLLALYRQWLIEGGELAFSVVSTTGQPAIPVRTKGDDDASWAVLYNSAQVPGVYLTAVEVAEPVVATDDEATADPERDPGSPQWYSETVDRADQWLGRQVRVTLSNGNLVEGRLEQVGERELEVARMVGGGEVVYPILNRAIDEFEVWRLGPQGQPQQGAQDGSAH
ncbi:MAG TPA: acetylornithine deacetylase [Marinobacter sp.]|nr:acetylornithine deacetylase [Marinobacter sp.]